MDYIGNKCPVCDKYFHIGDDIVVCPQCGTPCHRECYHENGKCPNSDKHANGYDYLEDIKGQSTTDGEPSGDLIICSKCNTKNAANAFFCSKCGNALHDIKDKGTQYNPQENEQNNQNQQGSSPFGPNVIAFDPLGGVKPDADFDDGVTAADAAKFVKQSTPYFVPVFSNIRNYSKSRFNFCAFFFSGGYLLYRKMYKIGAFITAVEAAIMIYTSYLSYYIQNSTAFSKLFTAYSSGDINATMSLFSALSEYDTAVMFLYVLLSLGSILLSIVIGVCANRMYYMHCKKQIVKIKSSVENSTDNNSDVDTKLKQKGGVNIGLALSLWVSYIILSYLPAFFY